MARQYRSMPPLFTVAMRIFWVFWLALWIALPAGAETLRAYVDRNPVHVDETLRLIVEFDGSMDPRGFDPAPLRDDFDVLGTSSSSRINIVNGRQESKSQLIIDLAPRREGSLVIPALSFARGDTMPISLNVLPPGTGRGGGEVFLEMEADPHMPYVQSPTRLRVKLFLAAPLLEGNISDPEIEDALVRRAGEDIQYAVMRDGVRYRVIERRFFVFPQRSGRLEIPPVVFDGRSAADGQRGFGSLFQQGRRLRARSESVELDVLPPPPESAGEPWLPAREVSLTESWPDDPPVFVVGEPVTRTLRVEALGVTGEQIPELSLGAVDGIRDYPDKPEIDTVTRDDTLLGIRERRVALVPAREGSFVLPAVEVKWWDTVNSRMRSARIPARTIEILPATSTSTATGSLAQIPDDVPLEAAPVVREVEFQWPWRATAVLLGVLWLGTLVLWWRARGNYGTARRQEQGPVEVGTNLAAVRAACRQNDARLIRRVLLSWAGRNWPDRPVRGLDDLAARFANDDLAAKLRALDAACYSDGGLKADGLAVWDALQTALDTFGKRPRKAEDETLPPLYRRRERSGILARSSYRNRAGGPRRNG